MRRLQAGDDEEDEPAADVHQAEPLVIDGDDPLVHRPSSGNVCARLDRQAATSCSHGYMRSG